MKIYDPPPFGAGINLVAGTTVVTGTASGILWNNAGVLAAGPATTDGSGNTVFPGTLGVGGALIAGNTFSVIGTGRFTSNLQTDSNFVAVGNSSGIYFGAANDAVLLRKGAANLQLGAAAVDTAPVAQTLSVQNTLAGGTSNVAGANWTLQASAGKGTGVGGDWAVQIAPAGSTGTVVNAFADALRIKGAGSVLVGIASVATNAADGFLYIAGNAGTPTGTPTTRTGYIPAYVDTTNSQMWLYMGGAWKQPKTPAGAALITWQ